MASQPPSVDEVKRTLARLRDSPEALVGDDVLRSLCAYLLGSQKASAVTSTQPYDHWFCSQADETTREAAVFLTRLHAYNSSTVATWRIQLKRVLSGCCHCVRGLHDAETTSKHTYFAAFSPEIIKNFYQSFHRFLRETVLAGLADVGITPGGKAAGRSLADAPPAVSYLLFSYPHMLHDSQIVSILHEFLPKEPMSRWPPDFPPPVLFLLLADTDVATRTWARTQVAKFVVAPMPMEHYLPDRIDILRAYTSALANARPLGEVLGADFKATFVQDSQILWACFPSVVRFVPPELFRASRTFDLDLRHLIIGHLHDTGNHLVEVLRCFVTIMKRAGAEMWKGEASEYPLVVFNSIKDNVQYNEMLRTLHTRPKDAWVLQWIKVFITNVYELPVFKDIYPTIMQYLCEELQHERFEDLRPAVVCMAAGLLNTVLNTTDEGDTNPFMGLALDALTVHSDMLINVALGKGYGSDSWLDARQRARAVLKQAMTIDAKRVAIAVTILSSQANGPPPGNASPQVHRRIWEKIYSSVQPRDPDAIALLLQVVSQVAHVDDLTEAAYEPLIQTSDAPEQLRAAVVNVNKALVVFRTGFGDALSRFTDLNTPRVATDLLKREGVVKQITSLMLSPVEKLQQAAQAVVSLAFDADDRPDCFRALLENFPEATLVGITDYLDTYTKYAQVVPEACNLSRDLAKCLTDVIEVLCASSSGLLHQPDFLKKHSEVLALHLPLWWQRITEALRVIFSRTPRWAKYFENRTMIDWMRDALILGRDLLAQIRTIEAGASAHSQRGAGPGRKLTPMGKRMVEDLQDVLFELTKWLRLTDEELLHQSFALLESLLQCFRESDLRPREETFQRVRKQIGDAREQTARQERSRLDPTRVLRLQKALGMFDKDEVIELSDNDVMEVIEPSESEDDIQILSGPIRPPKPAKKPAKIRPEKQKGVQKQTKLPAPLRPPHKSMLPDRKAIAKYASSHFTPKDQEKLDAETALPRMRRPAAPGAASSSKSVPPVPPKAGSSRAASRASSRASAVSSSSSEEESDEENEGGLKGLEALSKLQRTPTIKKPVERRQVKMLVDVPGQARHAKLDRLQKRDDAHRTILRLKPDISALHRTILSWDYNHTGPDPPGPKLQLLPVPPRFKDYVHYRKVFEPMLFLECWTQLAESKETPLEPYEVRIASRQFIDTWSDVDVVFLGSVQREWSLSDADVVIFKNSKSNNAILGKVQNYRPSPMAIQATVRFAVQGQDPGLNVSTVWSLSKVLSLSTLNREYAALMALPHYDLLDSILQTEVGKASPVNSSEIQKVQNSFNVNEPQANAILRSLETEGFALIQGPPGTGKTSTICGLVHLYLTRRGKPGNMVLPGRPAEREPVKKVLLCAPSNAAIDEIAYRLKEGVSGGGRRPEHVKVVRIGATKAIGLSVRDVSLETLIEQKINANPDLRNPREAGTELARLRAELESVKVARAIKLEEITNTHDNAAKTLELEEEVRRLNKQKAMLTHQLDKVRDKQKSDYRTMDATRRKFRTQVLQEADVICSTLSGAAYEYLEPFDFELVIIDEAAQAIELSSLIPLKYRCRTCIMVGDPQQLPPTVKSQEACKFGYDQSLFVRLQKLHPDSVHLLSIQYRMHPDISQLPSDLFYGGRLHDGPDMAGKNQQPWHSHPKLGTYRFFNVHAGQEESRPNAGHSLVNRAEAQVAVALFNRLRQDFKSADLEFRVGVISMYRGQIGELRRAFLQRFGDEILSTVDFNTVDGFQGQEKDIIILSCVRAGPGLTTVGFLRDVRRMNVALTRAKASLFILGHAPTLERSDDMWRKIVGNARTRDCLVDTDVAFFTAPISRASLIATKPAAPSRAPKQPPPPVNPPPPPDLVTPREMKEKMSGRPSASRDNLALPPADPSPVVDAVSTSAPSDDVHAGQKRRAEDDDAPTAAAATGAATEGSSAPPRAPKPADKPKPPPAKRPKQGPSLFIPKNKQRRP